MKISSSLINSSLRSPVAAPKRDAATHSAVDAEIISVREPKSSSIVVSQRQNEQLRYSEIIERNPQSKFALQSYLANGPRLSQQFDVEVLGIDTYV